MGMLFFVAAYNIRVAPHPLIFYPIERDKKCAETLYHKDWNT